jgi:hypothetical protein
MRVVRGAAIAAALLVLGLSTVACKKPGAGDPCRDIGRTTCVDSTHALSCRGYSWHLDRCLGPHACSEQEGACDQSVAEKDDTCGERGKLTCTADHQTMLRCDGAKFHEASSCRGANGCDAEHGRATCDTRIAREGDACIASDEQPAHACTADSNTELACVDGVFIRWKECRGENKCRSSFKGVTCDDSVALEGDPCHAGGTTCAVGRRAALQCSDALNGHWRKQASCLGPGGCRPGQYEGYVSCDQTVSTLGAPCNLSSGSRSCTEDGKTMLYCGAVEPIPSRTNQRHDTCAMHPRAMIAERSCPHKCEVTDSYYECS